jgi:hypothetical protein
MLWFEDWEHLDEYYNYLNTLANSSDFVDSTLALEELTLALDYESLKSTIYKDSLIDREKAHEDWIMDDVRTSILNSHREVRIGDSIYVNFSRNHYFVFPKDSSAIQLSFRNAPKGGFYDSIPWSLITPAVTLSSSTAYLIHATPIETITPTPPVITLRSPIDILVDPGMCDPLTAEYTFVLRSVKYHEGLSSEWIIDFGDGSLPELRSGNNNIIEHTYPDADNYTITIQCEYNFSLNGIWYVKELDEEFDVDVSHVCGILEVYGDLEEVVCTTNSDIKIERRFWYNNDFFGQGFGARTTHFKKNNNGNWRRREADVIEAHYEGVYREHSSCEVEAGPINETEHKTNARTSRVSKNIGRRCNTNSDHPQYDNCKSVFDGEITYFHFIEEGSDEINELIEFDACE